MRLLGKALTFDDVLLVPAFSQVLPRDTSLATRLSRNIPLNLPLVSAAGEVRGYVHQLDVLGEGDARPVATHLRPLPALPPDLPLDRALVVLRAGGQRMALVGRPGAPLGVVTLKDLVEEISGELARW